MPCSQGHSRANVLALSPGRFLPHSARHERTGQYGRETLAQVPGPASSSAPAWLWRIQHGMRPSVTGDPCDLGLR